MHPVELRWGHSHGVPTGPAQNLTLRDEKFNLSKLVGGRSSMVESKLVELVVAGSNPVGHPIFSLREKMPCRSAAKTGKNASAKFGPPLKFPLQTFDLTGEFPGRRRGERIPPVKSSRIEPLNRSGTPISRSACFQCKITPGRSGDRRSGSWGGNRWGRLGSKNSFNVRPHPGLLPPPSLRCGATSRGEGETFTASWNHPALDSRDGHSDNPRHTEAVPSPRGRGSG